MYTWTTVNLCVWGKQTRKAQSLPPHLVTLFLYKIWAVTAVLLKIPEMWHHARSTCPQMSQKMWIFTITLLNTVTWIAQATNQCHHSESGYVSIKQNVLWVMKVKGKTVPVHVMKTYRVRRHMEPLILNHSTKQRWVVNFAPWLFRLRERTSNTHWIRGWMGTRASLDVLEKRKISCPCPRNQTPENPDHSLAYIQTVVCQQPIIHTCEHNLFHTIPFTGMLRP
jgi:hypothetical protein